MLTICNKTELIKKAPPALVFGAEFDVLFDEAVEYASLKQLNMYH